MNAVVIVDKPAGLTSHDVVNRMRRILQERSIGHLGTLDPMATGVLPLVIGNFTRLAQFYLGAEKTYEGVIRFGFSTDTYDAQGEATSAIQAITLEEERVREMAGRFQGVFEQMPPPFSAKKIKGVPAYKLARKHEDVKLKSVKVEVIQFEILSVAHDRVSFRARVGSGTYVRSIAHEMGQLMGYGAHLESLRRTAVSEFDIADAHTLEEMAGRADDLDSVCIHPRKLLPQMPSVSATEQNAAHIRSGRSVNLPELSRAKLVKVFYGQRELIAIASRVAGTLFHPKIVLAGNVAIHPVHTSSDR
jgi:tRNA pseudouridine55 synthase